MKREEFIKDVATKIALASCEDKGYHPIVEFNIAQEYAEEILHYLIESGFRLPQKQNVMVYDENGQPEKHGPVEYGWDS